MKPKTWIKCSVIVLGVIIIPLLYSYFYLGAFWDPYNRLETVPVALVNLDEGAQINGEQRNIGNEVVDKIVDDGTMKFVKTDDKDATDGVNGSKYYAVIRVPKDFSKKVASSSETDKEISNITYSANMKHNYICSQIMKNAVLTVEEQTRDSINKEVVDTLCNKLKDVPDQMQPLSDGMNDLSDGSKTLTDGTIDFVDGQNTFTDGLNTYVNGMKTLNKGGKDLYSGVKTLNDGVLQVKNGTDELVEGTSALPQLVGGVNELNDGSKLLLDQTKLSKNYLTNPKTINDGITGLNDGLTQLYNSVTSTAPTSPKVGSQTIAGGMQQLSDSMFKTSGDTKNPSLYDGVQGVNNGVETLSASLSQSLPTLTAGAKDLKDGAQTYVSSTNYMLYNMITADTDKYKAQVTTYYIPQLQSALSQYQANQATMTDEQKQKSKAQIGTLTSTMYLYIAGIESGDYQTFNQALSVKAVDLTKPENQTPEKMYKNFNNYCTNLNLNEASSYGGALQLLKAADPQVTTLVSGGLSVSEGAKDLNDGVAQTKALSEGVTALKAGTNSLAAQFKASSNSELYKNVTALSEGSSQLAAAFADNGQLTAGIKQLKDGSDLLKTNYNGAYKDGVVSLAGGMQTLLSKATDLGKLTDGVNELNAGAVSLNSGSGTLLSGTRDLSAGINTATVGAGSLVSGNKQLTDAGTQLRDGAKELEDGINTAKDGVNDSISDTNDQLKQLDGLPEYSEAPVNVNEEDINHLPNYGSAFAPYFMSLSLYVGALLMFFGIYLDADERIKVLSRSTNNRVIRVLGFAGIGVAQAIVLGIVCQFALGLSISNIPMFYLSCIIISLVFVEIVGFLLMTLKDIGKFLSIAFLVLNLTSCGGTFPMETTPDIFRFLYPYMPMTYSVNLLKETTVNFNGDTARYNILVLLGIFALFVALNVIFGLAKTAKNKVKQMATNNVTDSKA